MDKKPFFALNEIFNISNLIHGEIDDIFSPPSQVLGLNGTPKYKIVRQMINGIQEIIKDEVNSVMLRLRVLVVLFGVLRLAESLISARRSCVSDIRILSL